MTWEEAIDDPHLEDLPFKIELDREGNLVMSQIWVAHGANQADVALQLQDLLPQGKAVFEVGVMTSDNVKVADVAWFTAEHWKAVENDAFCASAPAICVESACGGDPWRSLERKKPLYFEAGAKEVWFCDREGKMSFYTSEGQVDKSPTCPDFPAVIDPFRRFCSSRAGSR